MCHVRSLISSGCLALLAASCGAADAPSPKVYLRVATADAQGPAVLELPGPVQTLGALRFYDCDGEREAVETRQTGGAFSGGGIETTLKSLGLRVSLTENRRLGLRPADTGARAERLAAIWHASGQPADDWLLVLRPVSRPATDAELVKGEDKVRFAVASTPLVEALLRAPTTCNRIATLSYPALAIELQAEALLTPPAGTSDWQIVSLPSESDLDRVADACANPAAARAPSASGMSQTGPSRRDQMVAAIRQTVAGVKPNDTVALQALDRLKEHIYYKALFRIRSDRSASSSTAKTDRPSDSTLSGLMTQLQVLPDGSPLIAAALFERRLANLLTEEDLAALDAHFAYDALARALGKRASPTSRFQTSLAAPTFEEIRTVLTQAEAAMRPVTAQSTTNQTAVSAALQQLEKDLRRELLPFVNGQRPPRVRMEEEARPGRGSVYNRQTRRTQEVSEFRQQLKKQMDAYQGEAFFDSLVFDSTCCPLSANDLQRIFNSSPSFSRLATLLNERREIQADKAFFLIKRGFLSVRPHQGTPRREDYAACLNELRRLALRRAYILRTPELSEQITELRRLRSPVTFFDRLLQEPFLLLLDEATLINLTGRSDYMRLANPTAFAQTGTPAPPPPPPQLPSGNQLLPDVLTLCDGKTKGPFLVIIRKGSQKVTKP